MIFQKEFEYTDDAYDAALEITEKKIYRRINIITMIVMAIFTLILIIVSLASRQYWLLIAGLLFILFGGASYVFRSADLRSFIDSYSPEKWGRKFTRRYLLTLYDDRVNIDIYKKDDAGLFGSGRGEYRSDTQDDFYIGDDGGEYVIDNAPRGQDGPSLFSFEYDPLACRCYESEAAFLIFRKTYDCMPFLKEQLTDDEIWTLRSYFSERMGKKFVRLV